MKIKSIYKKDAVLFLQLLLTLDSETTFMLYEQNERTTTTEEMQNRIEAINKSGCVFAMEQDNLLVGFILIQRNSISKTKHCVGIAIGVLQKYHENRIATQLMKKAEHWYIINNISRIELTVMTHNIKAIKLYQKFGFKIEGIRKNAIKMNNLFYDEYYMGKLI